MTVRQHHAFPGPDGVVIGTARLELRRIEEDDADFMCALLNEPAFLRFVGDRGVRTPDQARAYIRDGPVASYEQHGFGLWLVQLRLLELPVGVCGLVRRKGLDDVDIGFAIMPDFRSRGFASESSSAVLEFARSRLRLERVVGLVAPENAASIRVLEKLGLRFERMIRLPDDDTEIQLRAWNS